MNGFWWIAVSAIFLCSTADRDLYQLNQFKCWELVDNDIKFISRSEETCFDSGRTSKVYSNDERLWLLFQANLFRGQIANQCDGLEYKYGSVSNYRKLLWSCKFEEELKFECPTELSNPFDASKVFFQHKQKSSKDEKIEPFPVWGLFSESLNNFGGYPEFILDERATEFACSTKSCSFDENHYQITVCKNGFDLREGLPYTHGNLCQQDSDCTLGPHLKCDKNFGLCEKITQCRTPLPQSTAMSCDTYVNTFTYYVAIAYVNEAHQYETIGIATIVGNRHLLTTITHFANRLHNNELYVLRRGDFFSLKNSELKPLFYVSHYNKSDWLDLLLITLDESPRFLSSDIPTIKKISTEQSGTLMSVSVPDFKTEKTTFETPDYCEEAFKTDFIHFDKSKMYCAKDKEADVDKFLNGAPIFVQTETGKQLLGIRSVNSVDPMHKKTYMIQKIGVDHCDWLAKASFGEVKCT